MGDAELSGFTEKEDTIKVRGMGKYAGWHKNMDAIPKIQASFKK